jgi:DNA modification methylase
VGVYGPVEPAVINQDGTIIGGHMRIAAAKQLGWTEFPVVRVELSDGKAKLLNLALNRIHGEWDEDKLAELLYELDGGGAELVLSGFDGAEIDKLLDSVAGPEREVPEPEEPPAEPITRSGDLILLGEHRLLCGDARDRAEIERVLDPDAITITDPPYGIGYEYRSFGDSPAENEDLVVAVLALAPRALVWTPGLMNLARELSREPSAKVLCWTKGFSAAGNGLGGASTWEPILVVQAKDARLNDDVLAFPTDREEGLRERHTCPKPVALWETLITAFVSRGGWVYDPFGGSGTTLIAAERSGRRCCAVEIDPGYCDVIVNRWEQYTGRKAERAEADKAIA